MKTSHLAAILCITSVHAAAQTSQNWIANNLDAQTMNIMREAQNAESLITQIGDEKVRGLPFLVNDWLQGEIDLFDGRIFRQYKIAFDTYDQTLLYLKNEVPREVTDSLKGFSFTDAGKTRTFINAAMYKKLSAPMFFEVLYSCDKGQLLKASRKIILRSFEKVATIKEFQVNENYYFYSIKENKLVNLKAGNTANLTNGLKLTDSETRNLNVMDYNFTNDENRITFFKNYCNQ